MEHIFENSKTQEGEGKADDCIAKLRRSSRNRESNDEIMELETELRRAYVAKELEAQLLEREAERYIQNVRKQQAEKLIRLEQQEVLENDLRQRSECLKRSQDYRKELTTQIEEKEAERNMMMEEARREREICTEVDRIREHCERSKTLEIKEELAESVRRERLILEEMKLIRCQEDTEVEAKKHREDEEYLAEIDERTRQAQSLRKEQQKKRERTVCEIAGLLLNREAEKRERETLLVELIAEDVKSELLIKEEEERVRRRKQREELAANLEEQIVFTEQCKLRSVEQDRAFGEEIMRKIMEDERTARLTADARRRMQRQYREDLVRLIETRRKIRDEELESTRQADREECQRERIKMEGIVKSRQLLLEKHGSIVGNFINKNALSEEERKTVESQLKVKDDESGGPARGTIKSKEDRDEANCHSDYFIG